MQAASPDSQQLSSTASLIRSMAWRGGGEDRNLDTSPDGKTLLVTSPPATPPLLGVQVQRCPCFLAEGDVTPAEPRGRT